MLFWIFFSLIAGCALMETGLELLNFSFAAKNRHQVPPELREAVDPGKSERIAAYTRAKTVVGLYSDLIGKSLILFLLVIDGFAWLLDFVNRILGAGPILSALVFFGTMALASSLLSLPFTWYATFRVEERFGFNRTGYRLWILDLIKGLLVSAILGGALLAMVVFLLYHGGAWWWLICWAAVAGFSLLMTVLYPLLLAPLFNKFTPLEAGDLRNGVEALMEKVGIPARGVFVMDAGKRSTHTNAYFTGLGRFKRIVFYDTLIKKHTVDEALAVLAHEAGHWKKRHVLKSFLAGQALSLGLFAIAGVLIFWEPLYTAFGFDEVTPFAGLFLVSLVTGPALFFLRPLIAYFSRRHEYEADAFARDETGLGEPLVRMLVQSAVDNLSNLNPHPLYVWFHYSHPPLARRIRACQGR